MNFSIRPIIALLIVAFCLPLNAEAPRKKKGLQKPCQTHRRNSCPFALRAALRTMFVNEYNRIAAECRMREKVTGRPTTARELTSPYLAALQALLTVPHNTLETPRTPIRSRQHPPLNVHFVTPNTTQAVDKGAPPRKKKAPKKLNPRGKKLDFGDCNDSDESDDIGDCDFDSDGFHKNRNGFGGPGFGGPGSGSFIL